MLAKEQVPSEGQQSSVWRLVIAFVVAGAICGIISSIVAVYVLGWHDSKFQNALNSALQVGLLDLALSLIVASIVFLVVVAARARWGGIASNSVGLVVVLGGLYPVGVLLLGQALGRMNPESLISMATALGFMILYPAIAAFAVKKAP
jgi:hypothetical protein